ncbi:MAG: hypothetical protein R3C05_04085 [Pirellulaceae bacterium]
MNDPAEASMAERASSEESWPPAPRLVTFRGCVFILLGLSFAFAMALAIVRTRHMSTEHTAPFWGEAVAKAIRLDRPVELLRPSGSTAVKDLDFYHPGWIDLTELRDLGYFRRVFLADENFDWSNARTMTIPPASADQWPWAYIRFGQSHPQAVATTIAVHLNEGWVGVPGGDRVACLNEGMRRRIAYRLQLFAKVNAKSAEPEL